MKASLRAACVVAAIAFCLAAHADPAARFVTAPPTPEIKASVDGADFTQEIVIQGTQQTKGLTVKVTGLTGPDPASVTCRVEGTDCAISFDIDARSAKTVKLTAKLPRSGTYSGTLTLLGTEPPQSVQLQVTRNAVFPVELAASTAAASTSSNVLTLSIPLQEKLDREAQLNAPSLALSRREPGKSALESVTVSATMRAGLAPLPSPWRIGRREAPTLLVDVAELDDAGEYVGRVRLTSPDSLQVLDVPVLITKKDSGWFAALLIALGAMVSLLLRTYFKSLRPRLQQRQAAEQLAFDLEALRREMKQRFAPLKPEEEDVLIALTDRLASAQTAIAVGKVTDAQPVLDEVDAKLSLVRRWINARRKAAALQAIPDDVRTGLIEVGATLSRAAALDIAAHAKAVDDLDAKIAAAATAQAAQRRTSLEEGIKASRYLDVAARETLLKQLANAARLDLGEQRLALDRIEQALMDRQLSGLKEAIEGVSGPPVGFDQASWTALSTDILNDIAAATGSAPDRGTQYRAIVSKYLRGLVRRQRAWTSTWESSVRKSANHTDDQKRLMLDRVPPVRQAIDSAEQLLRDGKLNEAAVAVENTGTMVVDLEADLKQGGFLSAGGVPAAAAVVPQVVDLQASLASALIAGLGLRARRRGGNTSVALSSLIDRFDLLVLAVALGISILLGLKLLWIDNATWGTANDYLVAILWGLGLHQVANTAFEGVGATAEKLAK